MHLKYHPSFVKRKGRISNRQNFGLKYLNEYAVENLQQIEVKKENFLNCSLEIGFGNAEHLIRESIKNPDTLFVGSEVYMSGIGNLLASVREHSIDNVCIFKDDIRILLDNEVSQIFDSVFIICPDPWPKEKHHKRRLINKKFLKMLTDNMSSNAELHISTDWQNYAETIIQDLENESKLLKIKKSNLKSGLSKFQRKGLEEGREIFYFNYIKK